MSFKRVCPLCGIDILYKSKSHAYYAIKDNRLCRSCSKKGEKNGFFNKKHDVETINNFKKKRKEWNYKFKTEEFSKKMSDLTKNENNGMFNKTNYDIWINKYDKDTADEMWQKRNTKISKRMSGKNNPMYGKPSPQGSGNGWSGWYKGWYFRSLRELSYMINVIERFNFKWQSVEKKEYAIKYTDWNGIERNYFGDFLINNKYFVEIKPKKLWNTPKILLKKEAAQIWCRERGYKYKLIDCKLISDLEIKKLYDNKNIVFTKKYEKKYRLLNEGIDSIIRNSG